MIIFTTPFLLRAISPRMKETFVCPCYSRCSRRGNKKLYTLRTLRTHLELDKKALAKQGLTSMDEDALHRAMAATRRLINGPPRVIRSSAALTVDRRVQPALNRPLREGDEGSGMDESEDACSEIDLTETPELSGLPISFAQRYILADLLAPRPRRRDRETHSTTNLHSG